LTEQSQEERNASPLENKAEPGGVTIRHGAIAFGGAALGVASLITLMIVVYVTGDDGLATIALVLAVFSFLIQMVIYVAQAVTANQQQTRAEQIRADSAIVLARIEALTLSVRETSASQNQSALDTLAQIASRAASQVGTEIAEDSDDKEVDPEDFERRVAQEVQKQIASNPSLVRLSTLAGATGGTLTPITSASQIAPGNLSRYALGGTVDPYEQASAMQRAWQVDKDLLWDSSRGGFVRRPAADAETSKQEPESKPSEEAESDQTSE
jgi:hypothetical protein